MKSIAFHINTLDQGGAERVVSNLANAFAKEGYEVYIATEWYGKNEYPLDERVQRINVGLKEEDEEKGRIKKALLRKQYLREFLEEKKPDVLVAFGHGSNYRALSAQAGTGVPVVICVRTDPTGHYDRFPDKIRILLLLPRAAGAVFQTAEQKAFFAPRLQDNSAVILNPINPKYLNAKVPEEKEKAVVHSARLVDFKNQPMLLDAFFMVHEKHPDYVLRIYGNDSGDGTKEILEKKIEEAGAKDFVFLMGGSEHLEEDLPKGSIYAFSSDWEGLPNSLMEAMALGMPVVATDCPCGGPAEIIRSAHMDGDVPETAYQYRSSYSNYSSKGDSVNAGRRARGGKEWPKGNGDLETANGILTPIRNPEAFAAAICRLIENPELARELAKSAAKIAERANEQAVFEQWRDYLERISRKK